jgi:hypothetical protein
MVGRGELKIVTEDYEVPTEDTVKNDKIFCSNHDELIEEFKDNILPEIEKRLKYYKCYPFQTKTKKCWSDKFKTFIYLTNPLIEDKPGKVFGKKGQGEMFSQLQPIFYDKSGSFWLWNSEKKCWKITDEIDLLNIIQESTNEDVISSKRRNEIINTLKQEGRKNTPKDIKPTWIQFQDIIYDVTTGEQFEAGPEWFVTNPIPYKTSSCADTPTMDKLFKEWVGEEYVRTL